MQRPESCDEGFHEVTNPRKLVPRDEFLNEQLFVLFVIGKQRILERSATFGLGKRVHGSSLQVFVVVAAFNCQWDWWS